MHEPDDYGLSDSLTLLQVGDSTPPPGFIQHWSDWSTRVWAEQAAFEDYSAGTPGHPGSPGSPGAPGISHTLRSLGGVRIGCRISEPASGSPSAIVVTSHGYGMDPGTPLDDQSPWLESRLAVVKVRVRGYPGSQFDTGDLTRLELGYITHGLTDRRGWVLSGAIADVVNATRAARHRYGPGIPIMLHGESFGGGLAVIAASLLAAKAPVARLCAGLPSLGWWEWRLGRPAQAGAGGIGFEVRRFLDAHRDHTKELRETLRMFDAMVHARRITCPLLFKIAERDEVVPAPTAAAVYNACGTDPGLKWRFVTRYGHFDGGLADARRHALFERLAGQFLDPQRDLNALMRAWEPVLASGERAPEE